MIYPNVIYHRDTGTEIFIDTLHTIQPDASAEVVAYRSAIDGSLKTFAKDINARRVSISGKITGKITALSEFQLRRYLTYLRGKEVFLMLGALHMANKGKITSFSMPKSVGTHTPLSLEFVCDTDYEGLFTKASEWTTYTGIETADANATCGTSLAESSAGSGIYVPLAQSDMVLPEGDYTLYVRVRDANQVPGDVYIEVNNYNDLTTIASESFTAASAYAIYTLDFTIDADDAGDLIQFSVIKGTMYTNTIYLDFVGFIKN